MVSMLTAAACLWAASPDTAQAQNPVTNGGFEQWDAGGLPVDWSILGDVSSSDDAHSGQHSALIRRDSPELEAGLNRAWQPDSGEQGTMLSELKGGVRFWYKALSASDDAWMRFFIIPMSARPFEDTGEQRAWFEIPRSHVEDGKWHVGVVAYDFAGNEDVKWVHLSPRIAGTEAALLLDDIEWLEKVGPVLTIANTRWEEDADRPGERATLAVIVKNTGDEAAASATVKVSCPAYVRVVGESEVPVAKLAPDDTASVSFAIDGRRDRSDVIGISIEQPGLTGEPAAAEFRLEPEIEVVQLRPERFILAAGEETRVDAVVRNRGTAICTKVSGELQADESVAIAGGAEPIDVLPDGTASLTWRITAKRQTPAAELKATLSLAGGDEEEVSTALVIGGEVQEAPDEAGAHIAGDVAWLQGDDVRLVIHRSEFGFGIADLQVKKRGWATVARLPSAGRIVVRRADGEQQELPLYGSVRARGRRLVVSARPSDGDGAKWQASIGFELRKDNAGIDVRSSLRCDRARDLLAFDGPMLYVGEGGFGSEKGEALFPGLDWLDAEDVSSEEDGRLIARGHPHQVRYVPHPNMITIPVMGVHHDGTTVGLLWDCRRKWDGVHDRPAAAFGSPDRFEGRNAHLMGLFVPSVGEQDEPWVAMNERIASVPYELPAGRELGLEFVIHADPDARDALSAMEEWFRVYGVPEARPFPRGTFEKEVAFSMRAYLESLWVEEEQQWWTSRGAGALLSRKGRPVSFVHELLTGAKIVEDAGLRDRCHDRAEEVLGLTGGRPQSHDIGFDYGGAEEAVIGSVIGAQHLMASQREDGSWRFDADRKDQGIFKGRDYHDLGPDDAAELGTCARNAYTVLRAARLTGAPEAYEAGVKALRFMKRYRVPRAAQVWEVMVHAPDILAAADAVDAYLEAYQYDGREEWLEEARRWGLGGLPFVYMWDDPELPFLLGASIPVFGASWEVHSWFGRPVQWNGLRHAGAMLKLTRYDDSMPWEQLARLLIVSTMYQQSADEEDIALWPDSISAIDASKSAWIFAPINMLKELYTLMGRPAEPETAILGELPERVHVSSGAAIRGARRENDTITVDLAYPSGDSGYTVLVNVARPAEVLLDGEPLPEKAALEEGDQPGWRHNSAYAMIGARITEDGRHKLELRGAGWRKGEFIPRPRSAIDFEFTESVEGWLPSNHLGDLSVERGVLKAPITAGDPYMTRPAMSVDGDSVNELVIRMRTPAGIGAQFYWGTSNAPGFTEERVFSFPVTGDGEWHEYRIPVGQHEGWKGQTITGIRIDPLSPGEIVTVEIDWIRGE